MWMRVLALILSATIAASGAAADAASPVTATALPTTATSHPFLTARDAYEAAGYVEQEYLLSGSASVYDWAGATGRAVRAIAGPTPYTTRIIVRRPRDPARFSGNVEVNILNASTGIDLGGPIDFERAVKRGDVWIGITSKSLTARALRRFDPTRYAALDWASPIPPAQRCARPSILPMASYGGAAVFATLPATMFDSAEEDGLVWDMIGQLALLLKSDRRGQILPGFRSPRVYLTGESQSALYMRTFAIAFHERFRTPAGRPAIDGYLATVGPAMVRLNQCSADVAFDDPRQKMLPTDVPYISLSSESEAGMSRHTNQPDHIGARAGWVTYEVAGASHVAAPLPGSMRQRIGLPSAADLTKIGMPAMMASFGPRPGLNDMPWGAVGRAAYENMLLWSQRAVAPPPGRTLERDVSGALARDADGNVRGGVRLPFVTVPIASYRGSMREGLTGGMETLFGPQVDLTPLRLAMLYRDHADYVAKFARAADDLVQERRVLRKTPRR